MSNDEKSRVEWTEQPIKIGHLYEYALYRRKVGDIEAYDLILWRISDVRGAVTFDCLAMGLGKEQRAILKDAGAFVLDIYRELEGA